MKQQTLINIVVITISLIGFFLLNNINKLQKEELLNKETEILKLLDDKIAEYQFRVNIKYSNSGGLRDVFERLDDIYEKLRFFLKGKEFTETDKNEMINYLMNDFAKISGFLSSKGEVDRKFIFEVLGVENEYQIFEGDRIRIVEKLLKLINPSVFSGRDYYSDFDFWEKKESWQLEPGDTTILMIRALKNFSIGSNQLELIENSDLKLIEPNLGELRVVIPMNAEKDKPRVVNFKTYDWINQDTLNQIIILK